MRDDLMFENVDNIEGGAVRVDADADAENNSEELSPIVIPIHKLKSSVGLKTIVIVGWDYKGLLSLNSLASFASLEELHVNGNTLMDFAPDENRHTRNYGNSSFLMYVDYCQKRACRLPLRCLTRPR